MSSGESRRQRAVSARESGWIPGRDYPEYLKEGSLLLKIVLTEHGGQVGNSERTLGRLLRDPGAGGRADCMVRNSGEEGLVITVATVAGLQLLVWHLPPWFIF